MDTSNKPSEVYPTFASNVVSFNQRVLKIEQRPVGLLSGPEQEISLNCLREEIDELEQAIDQGDLVGCVDALIDLKYFADGVLYKLGLTANTIDACGQAVHEANMEKKLGINHHRGDGQAADAVKPEGWKSPEERIATIIDQQMELFEG